jgi:hypothetical protein
MQASENGLACKEFQLAQRVIMVKQPPPDFSLFFETYPDDDAAQLAEAEIVKKVGLWEDPDFFGPDALYKDETMPPLGNFRCLEVFY